MSRTEIVQRLYDELLVMSEDGSVVLEGVGCFKKIVWPEYRGRNPRTGEPVVVPAETHITFGPDRHLLKALDPSLDDEELPPELEPEPRQWLVALARDVRKLLLHGRGVNLGVVGTLRVLRAGDLHPMPPGSGADKLPVYATTIAYTMSAELYRRRYSKEPPVTPAPCAPTTRTRRTRSARVTRRS
jgi:nucleoid DNA-binding protein